MHKFFRGKRQAGVGVVRRSLVLALAISSFLLVSASVAFISSSQRDNSGLRSNFSIRSLPVGSDDQENVAVLYESVSRYGVNLYKRPVSGDHGDHLFYGLIGDSANDVAGGSGVFRNFSRDSWFDVKPYHEANEYTLAGTYYSNSEVSKLTELVNELQVKEYEIEYHPAGAAREEVLLIGQAVFRESGGVLLPTLLAVFSAALYQASRRYRDCVVKVICGHARARLLALEYVKSTLLYWGFAVGLLIMGLPLLYLYNGWSQLSGFLSLLGVFYLIGFLVLLLGQTLTFWVLGSRQFFEVLKGYKPLFLIVPASVLLKITAFFVVVITLVLGAWNVQYLSEQIAKDDKWVHTKNFAATMVVAPNTPFEDTIKFFDIAVEQEAKGNMLLAAFEEEIVRSLGGDSGYRTPTLIVNNRYLQAQELLDSDGKRIFDLPEEDNHIYLLIPPETSYAQEAILSAVREWARERRETAIYFSHIESGVSDEKAEALASEEEPTKITLVRMAAGQELFTYRPPENTDTRIYIPGPKPEFMLFVPAKARMIGYTDYASGGGVIFTNPAEVKDMLVSAGLTQDYAIAAPMAESILELRDKRIAKLAFQAMIMLLAGLVLVLAGVVLTRIYCEFNARRHFVESISGRRFLGIHGLYLLLNAAALVFFCIMLFTSAVPVLGLVGVPLFGLYFLFLLWQVWANQNRLRVQVLAEGG